MLRKIVSVYKTNVRDALMLVLPNRLKQSMCKDIKYTVRCKK